MGVVAWQNAEIGNQSLPDEVAVVAPLNTESRIVWDVLELTQQRGEPLLFHVAQARRRLVEQQQFRIGAQRTRDLDDALLAERELSRVT